MSYSTTSHLSLSSIAPHVIYFARVKVYSKYSN